MKEYAFVYTPPQRAGHIVFEARNDGRLAHDLALVQLPAGTPPIDEQLRSKKRRGVPTIALIPAHQPKTGATFAVELTPGRYAIICFLKDADGVQHDQKGMSSEFRVR